MIGRRILPGSLVWVPDDGERGIVVAWNSSRTKVLVAFAAWKNGAELATIPDAQEPLFENGHGRVEFGWEPPAAFPKGMFVAWYPVEHVSFAPPAWEDRAPYCAEAYREDVLLTELDAASEPRTKLERLAGLYGWNPDAKGEEGEDAPQPDEHVEGYIKLLERDLDDLDTALGLAGEGRTRFYGDRLVRVQTLLKELSAYRSAAKAAKFVR